VRLSVGDDRKGEGPPPGADPGDEERVAAAPPARVLIVEDDWFVAMAIEQCVEDAGMKVVGVAAHPDKAAEICRADPPDFATMDIDFDGADLGVAAAGRLRAEFGVRSLFVSAFNDAKKKAEAAPHAPLGWIGKPFRNEELIAALKSAAAKVRAN